MSVVSHEFDLVGKDRPVGMLVGTVVSIGLAVVEVLMLMPIRGLSAAVEAWFVSLARLMRSKVRAQSHQTQSSVGAELGPV